MILKKFKRLLAAALAVSMIAGIVPASAMPVKAAEEKEVVDAAIFFSDLHSMYGGDASEGSYGYKKDIVTNMMTTLKNTNLPFSSVTSVGDAFSSNEKAYTGKTSVITGYIRSTLGNDKIPVNYTWSDHDRAALAEDDKTLIENKSGLIYGAGPDGVYGNADDGNYYVYAISHSDTSSAERYSQPSTFTEQKLVDFKNAVNKLDNTKPLFIASHQPLLARRGDNQYAYQWCTAINEVAKNRDVAFFFGHNHNYDKSGDYYCAKGDDLTVQNGSGTKTVTLNFTHMCAGYFNPVTTGSAGSSRQGTVMIATIYDDEINYTTYSASGKYTGSNAVSETVTRDHAVKQPKTVTYEDNILTIQATALGLTAIDAENVTGEYELDKYFTDHIAYDVDLTGHTAGDEIAYSMRLLDDMDDTQIELYHVDQDGKMTVVEYEVSTDESGRRYLEFKTSATGVFAYGAPAVPEGYTLSELQISNVEKTEYLVGDTLDLVSPIVKGVYTKEGSENFTRVIYIKDDYVVTDGYTASGYDMNQPGKQTVTISYGGLTTSFDIEVFQKNFRDNETGVSIEVTVPGVTGLTVTDSENQNVESALKGLVKDGSFVAYDIQVKDHKNGDAVTVTMPIPEGIANPVVYYVSDSGKTAKNMNATDNGDGTLSFKTDHFSTYVLADGTMIDLENQGATVESSTVTTTKEVWVKVDAPVNDGKYMIVSTGTAGTNGYVMGNNTAVTPVSGTLTVGGKEGTYTYIENATGTVWTAEGSGSSFSFKNTNNSYLGYTTSGSWQTSYTLSTTDTNKRTWTFENNNLYFTTTGWRTTYRYIRGGVNWSLESSNSRPNTSNVYFYQKVTATVTIGTEGGTYTVEGTDVVDAVAIANQTVDLTSKLYWKGESESSASEVTNHGLTPTYEVVTSKGNSNVIAKDKNGNYMLDGNTVTLSGTLGTAVIKVTYTSGDLTAWDEFVITTKSPHHYGIQLHKAEMTQVDITEFASGVTYYIYNSTTHTYQVASSYEAGKTYYTTPVIQGDEITEPVALKGIEAGDTYSVWAVVKAYASTEDNEGIELGTLGNALSWSISDPSIANIDTNTGVITFTGNNYGTFDVTVSYEGADGKPITDTITISVTDSLYIVPGDGTNDFPEYPNEGSIRFDKTATAVGNFSETGIAQVELSMTGVPYTTNNRLDVVLMLDRSSSMYKSGVQHRISSTVEATKAFVKNIVMNEDGTFNNNRIMVMDFLGGNLDSSQGGGSSHKYQSNLYTTQEDNGYQVISNQAELDALLKKIETDFKGQTSLYGTEYAQGLKGCYDALAASKEDGNKQFCVFMSDGIPNYMMGETTHFKTTNAIAATFDVSNRTAANGTASRNETKYEYEYYSTQMKNEGVTVFTVGLGLKNTNSAWNGTSKEVCEQVANMLLNDISGPAGETVAQRDTGSATSKLGTYFFSVADDNAAADMKDVFSNISQKIVEAAKDVVVEDKIGNKYSVNFALPENVTSEETDGLSEFYIQAVEYQLNANKEHTGDPAVLENFTFNSDGTFKSHSVDGVACNSCNHVTYTGNAITAINGTYFDYKSDSTGEYLTWENEKITTTELALQYFAHLDNSSDAVGTDHEVPAGTYYTNEYATLTYTNYNGNRVQEEFPIPQMTWNGAQVSYVFYLVNEAGQPVNRAGRVVPFAEAVYVTDVFTHSVVWNDLEQASALEADYLAENIVPDVYALYDDDASYNIHVYEDEEKSNLNNHFVIGGDVNDDYNKDKQPSPWSNANTTYVFNNKSDAIKYNVASAYITNDGKDTTVSNAYLCKGEGQVTATISAAANVTAANFANKPYFIKTSDDKYELAASYDANATYYEISSASYTAVSGETQWKPGNGDSTSGGTVINGCVYYIDETGEVYTIVKKTDGTEVREGFDFHNTTVAFAVVWKPELKEDVVVVDYGLDVVVDVIKNDAMAAGVVGVREAAPANVTMNSGSYNAAKATSADISIDANNDKDNLKELKIGTASVENLNSIRFSLDKTNGMQFSEPAKFYYEADVNYYDSSNELQATSMYSSVTVIPATTIYYEDNFIDFKVFDNGTDGWTENKDVNWENSTDGSATNATQDTDRPGKNNPVMGGIYDAENVYGYDSAYGNCSKYSLGSARKLTVNANRYGTAEFEFYGTGFDVIALTSNNTGTITVQVQKVAADGSLSKVKNFVVDTYYGYEQNDDGEWVVDNTANNSLYQVPVIESDLSEFGYDHYKVTIKAAYNTFFDHVNGSSDYDMYIDAIRIYDPANDGAGNDLVKDAYVKDGEYLPKYIEVRNLLITANTFDKLGQDDDVNGIVFIDGDSTVGKDQIADYASYGPNNEVYLAKGQSIAFDIPERTNVKDIQIGLKSADGSTVDYNISGKTGTLKTSTGMYYSILEQSAGTVVITNTSENDSILSVTDIKVTFTTDPYAIEEAFEPYSLLRVSRSTVDAAMNILEPPTEEPELPEAPKAEVISAKTDKGSYKVGDTVTTTVVTNEAAAYVTVNGKKVTDFTEKKDTRIWTVTTKATEAGKLTFAVVAYNSEDVATEEITTTVEVKQFAPKTFKLTLNKSNVLVGDKIKATVTTSTDVKYVTINGKKVTKYASNKKAGSRTWTLEIKASKAGNMTVKAVAFDKKDLASKELSKKVTVKQFVPKKFKIALSKSSAVVGDKIKATVTTSTDVKYVTIDGKKVTKYTSNKKAGTRTWTLQIKVTKTGDRTIKVVAYNKDKFASGEMAKVVNVKKFEPKTFKLSTSKNTVKRGQKYTITVTTSSDVKYVKVDGKKIKKYTTNKSKTQKTFKVTYKATKAGKKTVKVVAYNKNGVVSSTKTITVNRK